MTTQWSYTSKVFFPLSLIFNLCPEREKERESKQYKNKDLNQSESNKDICSYKQLVSFPGSLVVPVSSTCVISIVGMTWICRLYTLGFGFLMHFLPQEIGPTLKELGISTPEELGYDKPELALASVYD